jgi:hypothetical protein
MLSLSDLSNAIGLTMKLVERLDKKTVDSFTSF